MARGGNKKNFFTVLILLERSCTSEHFNDIQDIDPSTFFQYIYHVGCAINSRLIFGGQNSSKRQTVFFCLWFPWTKNYKDPDVNDLSVPRRAQHLLHKAWKRHRDAVYSVDTNLAIKK